MKRPVRIVLILGLVAILALAGATAVSAWGPGFGRRPVGASGLEAVAGALGMSVEDLQADLQDGKTIADLAEEQGVALQTLKNAADAARDAAVRDRIEQAVTDDQLTREQADWMLRGMDAGFALGGRGRFPGRMPFGTGGTPGGMEAAAEALGMTADEMALQFWGGRSLADLAERADVELEDVQDAIEAARKAAMREAIAQAVEDGRLTQEQADWMLQGIEQGFGPRGGMMGRGRFPGGMRGCGGFRGRDVPSDEGASFPGARLRDSRPI